MTRATAWLAAVLVLSIAPAPVDAQTDVSNDDGDRDRPSATDRADVELERLRAAAQREVDRRLQALDTAAEAVGRSTTLTADHRALLTQVLDESRSGLRAIRSTIATVESLPQLRRAIGGIVDRHWVYGLQLPRAYQVMAADSMQAVIADLAIAHDALATTLDRAEAVGVNVTDSRASLAAAIEATRRAESVAHSVTSDVLMLGPEDMPGAAEVMTGGAGRLRRAFEDLRSAVAATRRAVTSLRTALAQSNR